MSNLEIFIQVAYLVSISLFIVGLQKLSSPATARKGNLISALGMLVAVAVTLFDQGVLNYQMILAGIVIGALIGAVSAKIVQMTAMPQMVALFNGLGGAASALVAVGEQLRAVDSGETITALHIVTIILSILIGGITFTGSLMAFGKLQELITGRPLTFPGQKIFNSLVFIGFIYGSIILYQNPTNIELMWGLTSVGLLIGVLLVMPIGGADMPVVISLLNSLSGVAAAIAGFVVNNNVLIVSGALVGASGLILTNIMCKGMNRTIGNVIFGSWGASTGGGTSGTGEKKTARSIDSEDAAMMLAYAGSVVIVPGYGMAVAQAQHVVREMGQQLEAKGVDVKYAIHPVAGRMPGHMNVLLAEANVPYPQLHDMEDINPAFEGTDVALVIGANDVVNPDARENKGSPIYGMPILNVDKAKNVIVIKRSLNTGFAGIDNPLFYNDNTKMLFGSAKEAVQEIVAALKEL